MSIQTRYAVTVPNGDMSPRMFKDESVIFEKDLEPRSGDDVVIVLSTGAYLIRELVSMSDRELQVHTYVPDATMVIPLQSVAGVYPIVQRCFCPLHELLAWNDFPEVHRD